MYLSQYSQWLKPAIADFIPAISWEDTLQFSPSLAHTSLSKFQRISLGQLEKTLTFWELWSCLYRDGIFLYIYMYIVHIISNSLVYPPCCDSLRCFSWQSLCLHCLVSTWEMFWDPAVSWSVLHSTNLLAVHCGIPFWNYRSTLLEG